MLNDKQKRYLRGLAHERKVVVIVGQNGLSSAVLDEIDKALAYHELVKIRVNADNRDIRAQMIEQLCTQLDAELVQKIGHVATLFRPNVDTPKVTLP